MNIFEEIKKIPKRVMPNIISNSLNDPIEIMSDGFTFQVNKEATAGVLDGTLRFEWFPSSRLEFEGIYNGEAPDIGSDECTILLPDSSQEANVLLTNLTPAKNGWHISGIINDQIVISKGGAVEEIRFYLVNFPDFIGDGIRDEGEFGPGLFSGRLPLENEDWSAVLDKIPEVNHLKKASQKKGGYYISHVGLIKPKRSIQITSNKIKEVIDLLHYFFGFCCGTWSGPLFIQGLNGSKIIWQSFASWKTGAPQRVQSWFPTHFPGKISELFKGFIQKYFEPDIQKTLINAISWLIEANHPQNIQESSIVISQIALEALAWTHLVELKHHYTPKEFSKLPAHKRIRKLLSELSIPTRAPTYLSELQTFVKNELRTDGPGTLTKTRNALVHSTKKNRKLMSKMNSTDLSTETTWFDIY